MCKFKIDIGAGGPKLRLKNSKLNLSFSYHVVIGLSYITLLRPIFFICESKVMIFIYFIALF